eukprot:4888802-Pleurochrysis_carterae.AAC.1
MNARMIASTLHNSAPAALRRCASRVATRARPTHPEATLTTSQRVEPCPRTLCTYAPALLASHAKRHSGKHGRGLSPNCRSVGFIVDSGCSWHVHPHAEDLTNARPCTDKISGVDGKPHQCTLIGDMPVAVKDRSGIVVRVTFKNVRCVPTFNESLLSVSQLWDTSSTECRVGAHNDVISPPMKDGK